MSVELDNKRRLRDQAYDSLNSVFSSLAYCAPELMASRCRDLVIVAAALAMSWGVEVEVIVDDIRASKARS